MHYIIKSLATQKYLCVENIWSFAPSWSEEPEHAKRFDSFDEANVVKLIYSKVDLPIVLAVECAPKE